MARKSRKNVETAPIRESQKPMFYAGAYIRLSVVDRKSKGDSIENQQAIINSFIAGQDNIELRECYIDNGHSGQSFERPAFLRMIADMESGKINCCITKDLSRLGRNAIDSGYYIERHFPAIGVRYIAVTDDYDSADGQSGGIMLSLKNMINEAYALDASRKVKTTIQMNVRKGNFVGKVAPYGYFKSDDDCHKLVIDNCAASVVRRMFEMAAEGKPRKAILDWLNISGHLPPRRYFHSIGLATGKEVGADNLWWAHRAVSDILRNRMYCGDMIQGKHKVVNNAVTQVPKPEWVVVENTHEAIVDRELFDAVQKTFTKPDEAKEPYYKNPKTENVFARKVFCGHCGYAMIRKRGGEKFYGYNCNTRLLYSPKACAGMLMTESALKSEMLRLIREYEPHLAKVLSPSPGETPDADNPKKELSSVQSEFDRNKRFLEGLYESLVSGDISDDEYKDMKSAYEIKIASLTEQIKRLREEILIRASQEAIFAEAHANMQRLEQVSDLTAEIVDRLVERITVCPNGRIEVKFSFLDEPVYNKAESAEHE
jgi:DNA invertase Pin-like site-specific DNA recombinase